MWAIVVPSCLLLMDIPVVSSSGLFCTKLLEHSSLLLYTLFVAVFLRHNLAVTAMGGLELTM